MDKIIVLLTEIHCRNDQQTDCSPVEELDLQMFSGQADDLGQGG